MTTTTQASEIRRIDRAEAKTLAEREFEAFADDVRKLAPEDWTRPTDCALWDVRAMVLHVLGAADAQASVQEFMHQFRRGYPLNKTMESHHWVDGINELQIRERRHLGDDEIVEQIAAVGSKAVRGRWRTPLPMRYLPISFGPPLGWKPLKYLLDVGFTRDVWMHRIDLAVATGRDMEVTAEHDGRLIADIVAEWAEVHGHAFTLVLDGPAGGRYSQGEGGEAVTIDAIEFVRILAGRVPGTGVLANPLPL